MANVDSRISIDASELDDVIEKVDGMWRDLGLPGSGKRIWK